MLLLLKGYLLTIVIAHKYFFEELKQYSVQMFLFFGWFVAAQCV